ncbi:MAG: iron-sulfur cluster assembly accessory protein [Tatlockia sp.]|jgi:iron-sulfur cluster assembly protein
MSEVMQHVSDTTQGIHLTDAALQHVVNYLARQEECKGIRLSVKKTGCSGLSYVIDYVQAPSENDCIQPLTEALNLYIDKGSYPYLKGMQMDYVKEGLNYKFVFQNPNQTGQCGCGESFTVDS